MKCWEKAKFCYVKIVFYNEKRKAISELKKIKKKQGEVKKKKAKQKNTFVVVPHNDKKLVQSILNQT